MADGGGCYSSAITDVGGGGVHCKQLSQLHHPIGALQPRIIILGGNRIFMTWQVN